MTKTTFEKYNPDVAGVTKEVNGLTLVWSEELERFVLPVGNRSPFQIVFDELSGNLIQVQNADFIYADRKAQAPDGTVIQERVFIGRIPRKKPGAQDVEFEEVFVPDPEVQRALIRARWLELKKVFVEHLLAVNATFLLGSILSVVVFFWYFISNLGTLVKSLTTGAAPAIGEFGYVLIWVIGAIVLGFVAKYTLPALFRRSSFAIYEEEPSSSPEANQNTTINVNVNQGSRTGGDNSAQA